MRRFRTLCMSRLIFPRVLGASSLLHLGPRVICFHSRRQSHVPDYLKTSWSSTVTQANLLSFSASTHCPKHHLCKVERQLLVTFAGKCTCHQLTLANSFHQTQQTGSNVRRPETKYSRKQQQPHKTNLIREVLSDTRLFYINKK